MQEKIQTSDLQILLQLFAPKVYNLRTIDTNQRLSNSSEFNLKTNNPHRQNVLINLDDNLNPINTKDIQLIFHFGKPNNLEGFKCKQFNYINNKDHSIRWFYKPNNLQSVLSFYNTSSLKSKLYAGVIKLAATLRLERWIRSGQFSIYYKTGLQLEKALTEITYDDYSIFMGTKGAQRTPVIALLQSGQSQYFAKVALNDISRAAIKQEKFQLNRQRLLKPIAYTFPQLQDCPNPEMAIVSNNGSPKMFHAGHLRIAHYNALSELFKTSKGCLPLKQSPFWFDSSDALQLIRTSCKSLISVFSPLLYKMKNSLSEYEYIVSTLAHGDFTPWNIKVNDELVYIFDWEMAQFQAPALFDLFHFHFQNDIIRKRGLADILNQIRKSCDQPLIKQLISDNELNRDLYLKLYLYNHVSTQLALIDQQEVISKDQLAQLKTWKQALCYLTEQKEHTQRGAFIDLFPTFLSDLNHAFIKLQSEHFFNYSSTSDLDIAVRKEDRKSIISYCNLHPSVNRCTIRRMSFMTVLELVFNDGTILNIDLIHQFKRKSLQMMCINELLNSAHKNKFGISIPDRRYDLEYTYLFYTLNKSGIPLKYSPFFSKQNPENQRAFDYLKNKYQLTENSIDDLFTHPILSTDLKKKIAKQAFQSFTKRVIDTVSYLKDTIVSITTNRGFIITFTGVDGVGKTTIIEKVTQQLMHKYRKEVVLLRHRPGILPILSSAIHGSRKKAEEMASINQPRQGTNSNLISSLMRFVYYYVDYLVGQFYVYFKYILRGKIVLYDRYYFDFIVDGKRSNFQLNQRFTKALYTFILKPKINILLWAKSEIVYRRKQELTPETIQHLSRNYRQLFYEYKSRFPKSIYQAIENNKLTNTLQKIDVSLRQVI